MSSIPQNSRCKPHGETNDLADHHDEVSTHVPTSSGISNIPEYPNKPMNFKFPQQQKL